MPSSRAKGLNTLQNVRCNDKNTANLVIRKQPSVFITNDQRALVFLWLSWSSVLVIERTGKYCVLAENGDVGEQIGRRHFTNWSSLFSLFAEMWSWTDLRFQRIHRSCPCCMLFTWILIYGTNQRNSNQQDSSMQKEKSPSQNTSCRLVLVSTTSNLRKNPHPHTNSVGRESFYIYLTVARTKLSGSQSFRIRGSLLY